MLVRHVLVIRCETLVWLAMDIYLNATFDWCSLFICFATCIMMGQILEFFNFCLQLRKVEIEKQYSDSLVESTRRRYEEEIMAIEKSYK